MCSVDSKTMEIIEIAVLELAAMDYPRVWIGEEGITPTNSSHESRKTRRVGDGRGVEGTEGGMQMPEVSVDWLDSR